MSKIFSALKKAQGDLASLASPVIDLVEESGKETPNAREQAEPATSVAPPKSPTVPAKSRDKLRRLPIRSGAGSVVAGATLGQRRIMEEYRMIRTKLVQHPRQPKVLVVSSAGPGDGKSVNAVNLAWVLSLRDTARVLLIDADLRRPTIASTLGLPPGPGLSDVLDGSETLQDALIQVEQFPNLYVLTAGQPRANPTELLDTSDWKDLCVSTKDSFDFVIVDSPPVGVLADFELIRVACEGVILVARPDHTDLSILQKTFGLVPRDKLIGVVMNCSYDWFLWKTHESYFYGYYDDSLLQVSGSKVV